MAASHTYAIARTGLATRPRIVASAVPEYRTAVKLAAEMLTPCVNGGVAPGLRRSVLHVVRVPNGTAVVNAHTCTVVAIVAMNGSKARTLHLDKE